MKELAKQTKKLKQYLDMLQKRYESNDPPENMKDATFFAMMKTNTKEIYEQLEIWEKNALQMVKEQQINVHPHQVVSTKENMELIILHSYYVDTRRKRYMELNQSSHYIFDQMLRSISTSSEGG